VSPSVRSFRASTDNQDGVPDSDDNCVNYFNPNQADQDGDGVGDVWDDT
jgi:hypothetical protein